MSSPEPSTAIVGPPASRQPRCAAESTPRASPLATTTPRRPVRRQAAPRHPARRASPPASRRSPQPAARAPSTAPRVQRTGGGSADAVEQRGISADRAMASMPARRLSDPRRRAARLRAASVDSSSRVRHVAALRARLRRSTSPSAGSSLAAHAFADTPSARAIARLNPRELRHGHRIQQIHERLAQARSKEAQSAKGKGPAPAAAAASGPTPLSTL